MDSSILHILLTSLLGIVVATVSFLIKGVVAKIAALEKDLADHKLSDASEFAELHAHKDEVMRRLDSIEIKVDRLLERK
jgi:hypothetical protein